VGNTFTEIVNLVVASKQKTYAAILSWLSVS